VQLPLVECSKLSVGGSKSESYSYLKMFKWPSPNSLSWTDIAEHSTTTDKHKRASITKSLVAGGLNIMIFPVHNQRENSSTIPTYISHTFSFERF
jgi:hypothetical protein